MVETVGVGQSETDVAEVADTVAVIVQPGSGDVLQFLKAGIMEIPDVLVVTKADLGDVALRARRDLHAALRSLGDRETEVVALSSIAPVTGIDELVAALDAHRERLDLPARRLAARRASALADFAAEHGERGLRALGGRRAARARAGRRRPRRRRAGPRRRPRRPGGRRVIQGHRLALLARLRGRHRDRGAAGRGQPRHGGDLRADRLRRRARVGAAQALRPRGGACARGAAQDPTATRSTREPAPPSATLARAVTRW